MPAQSRTDTLNRHSDEIERSGKHTLLVCMCKRENKNARMQTSGLQRDICVLNSSNFSEKPMCSDIDLSECSRGDNTRLLKKSRQCVLVSEFHQWTKTRSAA